MFAEPLFSVQKIQQEFDRESGRDDTVHSESIGGTICEVMKLEYAMTCQDALHQAGSLHVNTIVPNQNPSSKDLNYDGIWQTEWNPVLACIEQLIEGKLDNALKITTRSQVNSGPLPRLPWVNSVMRSGPKEYFTSLISSAIREYMELTR